MDTRSRIGPNAVLQHLPVLDTAIGKRLRVALLLRAGVDEPHPGCGMLPEDEVVSLHRAVWLFLPDKAEEIQRAAGLAVGDYILANRIPRAAGGLIRALPAFLGARLLSAAITRHAWTFAGSGAFGFTSRSPLTLRIAHNPLAVGPARPSCHWHAAVFERLFQRLVWPDARVTEIHCCAAGDMACEFRIAPQRMHNVN